MRCDGAEGPNGAAGVGGRFNREEAICELIADSHCCIAEANTTL